MATLVFTQADLDNAKAALVSNSLEVRIGDRIIKYRSQKQILELIQLILNQINGVESDDDNPAMIQSGYKRGTKC